MLCLCGLLGQRGCSAAAWELFVAGPGAGKPSRTLGPACKSGDCRATAEERAWGGCGAINTIKKKRLTRPGRDTRLPPQTEVNGL